jgi:hypothetical protein
MNQCPKLPNAATGTSIQWLAIGEWLLTKNDGNRERGYPHIDRPGAESSTIKSTHVLTIDTEVLKERIISDFGRLNDLAERRDFNKCLVVWIPPVI